MIAIMAIVVQVVSIFAVVAVGFMKPVPGRDVRAVISSR